VFIGYDEKTKAYRLFNPITKKVIMSRDVQVDEESKWKWNNLEKESRSLEIDTPPTVRDHELLMKMNLYSLECEACKTYTTRLTKYMLYVSWQIKKT